VRTLLQGRNIRKNFRDEFWRLNDRLEALIERGFPDVGQFAVEGWPVPGDVELSVKDDEVLGRDDPLGPYLSFIAPPWRWVKPKPTTFAEYLALARSTPEAVLKFAKRYGPLLGWETTAGRQEGQYAPAHPTMTPLPDGRWSIVEWVGPYISSAEAAERLIRIANALRRKETPTKSDWNRMMRPIDLADRLARTPLDSRTGPDGERAMREVQAMKYEPPADEGEAWWGVTQALRSLVGGNPFNLSISFSLKPGARLELNLVSTLGTYLNMQILIEVGRRPGVAFCGGCLRMFTPERAIPPSKQAWCRKCRRRGADDRERARRYYQRHRVQVLKRVRSRREIEL
jgi:hypothetical protein